jgi:hypothetical protein
MELRASALGPSRLSAELDSSLPNGGISVAMEYRQDNNAMLLRTKINAVWETIGDDTPNVLANNGKLERVLRCQRYATVNFSHELMSKAKSLAFIPCTGCYELCTGGTMKSDG